MLYFTHPVDAMLPMGIIDFKGHKLVSVDSAELDLEDVGRGSRSRAGARTGAVGASMRSLTLQARVKEILGERVSDVRESKTLVDSPARLVSQDESTATATCFASIVMYGSEIMNCRCKALELNPRHPLMHNLSVR